MIGEYIRWYNHERRHSSLDKKRPYEVMIGVENNFGQINKKRQITPYKLLLSDLDRGGQFINESTNCQKSSTRLLALRKN